jgi:hypothetical protein
MTLGYSRKECPNCHCDVPGSYAVCHQCGTMVRKPDMRIPVSRLLETLIERSSNGKKKK